MNNYYITFGSYQHDIYGGKLDGTYVVIAAESEIEARRAMFARCGPKWSGIYTEEQFAGQIEKYGYTEVWLDELEVCCGRTQLDYDELERKYLALKNGVEDD